MNEVLRLHDLHVGVRTSGEPKSLVHGVSLTLRAGERAALVGESGSGKTMVSLSVMRLNPEPTVITAGEVLFDGHDLVTAPEREMERTRGGRIAMIYQDPLSCLNPVRTVGAQLVEAVRAHQEVSPKDAWARAVELLEEVGVPDAAKRVKDYPHQFSGGMRQRVMIAMAVSCSPDVLIADEPTTALDVTTQARILALLDRLAEQRGMAILFITHDLAVAATLCREIHVMRSGLIVESGALGEVLTAPKHAYTKELLGAVVTLDREPAAPATEAGDVLVEADDLVRRFGTGVTAVNHVSLEIKRGETFGLVGESGSGKSTLSQLVLGLDTPTSGTVRYDGVDLFSLGKGELRRKRRAMQVVLQDPVGSLNRRKTVEHIIGLPLAVHEGASKQARKARVAELLDLVGLPGSFAGRYPRELSGGQCQRVNIARAIALEPEFLVLDEAVSAVDVVIQAQILELLRDLQDRLGLTCLFVSHDLAVVRYMAPRLAVMHHGEVVETGTREEIFENPQHEYTRSLLAAIPSLDERVRG
ncbi:ABC transporter ATP-binding protein [Amycolatopsis sp. CA-230715]|uniref:ABC transporter ATP-binding protein n=1 Tax=Amycolatopsis sp. CA-230715 TaxID=2745196 RepID=UPI001C036D63|nr:ABC transporter ATP-binding protein [Amycolatopsis sp. CA-230715]QWF84238.1 Glutathione import ATP-binding protein GsiA [Amycolatopsis sp. CA-230715]